MENSYRAMLRGWDRMGRADCVTEVMLQLTRLMKREFRCHLAVSYTLDDGSKGTGTCGAGPEGGTCGDGSASHLIPAGCCGLHPFAIRLFLQHPLPLQSLPLMLDVVRQRRRVVSHGAVPAGLLPSAVAGLFPPGFMLGLPMQVRGRLVGFAFAVRDRPFSSKETALLGWTVSHAALAVSSLTGGSAKGVLHAGETPDLFDVDEGTRHMLVGTVSTLINAIEAKSSWTKGHSERVMRTSAIIAAGLGLGEGEVERVRLGGLLHDIGKIGVDGVLENTGRLEYQEDPPMKRHPEKGVAILSPIPELKGVLPGILHHHERFDGSGYPAGLRGEEIPLDARIISVADAFDAMVSERPYKSGSRWNDALTELEICAGSHFDPEIVRCLSGFIKGENDPFPPPP